YYKRLIDASLAHPVKICIFVLDKTNPLVNYDEHFKSTWDAYIWYTMFLIKHNVKIEKPCIMIMDFLSKPGNHPKYIESEVKTLPQVENATMLESESANLIQMIDILVGCVTYEFRRKKNPELIRDKTKGEVVDHLKSKLDIVDMATKFTVNRPVYFNVWPFSPNK
ncbi:hypothetical protein KKB99_04110, partial [bacterium]|nr:hypothetical protein [bacterium]MBU1025178.1 hypothetical protein [bacterium]